MNKRDVMMFLCGSAVGVVLGGLMEIGIFYLG